MASFNDLPLDILLEIFSYLSRRDRITCMVVCTYWKEALDSPCLWRNMSVYLDADLLDPSTVIATRYYSTYFKTMEFCWANPRLPVRWMQHGLHEFSKRACRYIMILQDYYVQLKSIKIVDWYEVPKFKKITYHLCKFLRSQINLERISFISVNFTKVECVKLLVACLTSVNSIKYMEISNCRHGGPLLFESATFISCLEHFSNLSVLKFDYTSLCGKMLEAIISSRNTDLELLDVTVRDFDYKQVVPAQTWQDLRMQCSRLKVAIHIRNVCHYEDIYKLLQKTIPLSTFTLSCGRIWDQTRSRQYRRTISLLTSFYYQTLENVCLQISYNKEVLDDLILSLLNKCTNLKCFDFQGVIKNMNLLREICRMQTEDGEKGFKSFRIFPTSLNPHNHLTLSKLHKDYSRKLEECNVDFKICNTFSKNLVYVYY